MNLPTLDLKRLRVFRLKSHRLVVIDPMVQPGNGQHVTLYFVHGAALRVRERSPGSLGSKVTADNEDHAFAVEQYSRWWHRNPEEAKRAISREDWEVEELPDLREPCPKCAGQAHVRYTVGSFAESAGHADGVNVVETCDACHGEGYRYVLFY